MRPPVPTHCFSASTKSRSHNTTTHERLFLRAGFKMQATTPSRLRINKYERSAKGRESESRGGKAEAFASVCVRTLFCSGVGCIASVRTQSYVRKCASFVGETPRFRAAAANLRNVSLSAHACHLILSCFVTHQQRRQAGWAESDGSV